MSTILALDTYRNDESGGFKSVLVVESKSGITLKSAVTLSKNDVLKYYSKADIRISCSYDGIINETIEIPPVKKDASRIMLFKNKMREHFKTDEDYSFIYFENPGVAEPPKINYTVYAAPSYSFIDTFPINKNMLKTIQSYTFNFFSIMGISNSFDKDSTVFHAYSDKNRIIIVVSTGTKLQYTRSSLIPEGTATEEEFTNFYYENINLTFLYVRQSFSGTSMKILLTGDLENNETLKTSVESFVDQPISTIEPDKIIKGATKQQLNEYLIPIGTTLLRGSFDFSGKEHKEARFVDTILKYINVAMFFVILGFAATFLKTLDGFNDIKTDFETRSKILLSQEQELIKNIGSDNALKVGNTYLTLIKAKSDSPMLLLAGVQDILNFYKFSQVVFSGKGKDATVHIIADLPQQDFITLEDFNKDINKKIAEAENRQFITKDGSVHTLKELRNRISVFVSPTPATISEGK